VGVGPAGLVPYLDGRPVPVLEVRSRRGGAEATIRLPGGELARVRTPDIPAHRDPPGTLAVRLDPAGCVVVGGTS
jgi:hypothetical protein